MNANLNEILAAREHRRDRQEELLRQFSRPLICFTMNIPGPEKNHFLVSYGFALGDRLLREALPAGKLLQDTRRGTAAGPEGFYAVDASPEELKAICVRLEEKTPGGRVFDLDVLRPDGSKVERRELGLPERKCLLCGEPAAVCGRSRNHSLTRLQEKTWQLLADGISRDIGRMAVQSLLCELYATPKPGLVDQNNNGSHGDMDFFTFLRSAAALEDYFSRCAYIGLEGGRPGEIFARLREAGLEAEKRMLRATGGINTHKGAIFSLGILCGAAGTLLPEQWQDPGQVSRRCAALARGLVRRDFEFLERPVTAGERLFEQHGITGARGQAESGFSVAWKTGLPVLEQGLEEGRSFNDCLCAALLHILVTTQDTNLIKRSNLAVLGQIQGAVSAMLAVRPYPESTILEALDQTFIRRNLSPGGSADLLAATCFFYFLKRAGAFGNFTEADGVFPA